MTVIRKNEVLEQMGRSAVKNRGHSTDLYFERVGGPSAFSVANGRKLFNSFTRATVPVSGRTKATDLSKEKKRKNK